MKLILIKQIKSIIFTIISYIAVMFCLCLTNLTTPYLTGQFVDYLTGNDTKYLFSTLFITIVIINFMQIVLRYVQTLLISNINNDMMHGLSNEVFQKIFRSKFSQFYNIDKAYLIDQIYKDCQAIISFLTSNVTNFVLNSSTLLACLCILFQIDSLLCFLLSLTIPLYIVTYRLNKEQIHIAHKRSTEKSNQYFSRFAEQINKLVFIKRNSLDKEMEMRLKSAFQDKKQATINAIKTEYIFTNTNQMIIVFAYMCIIGIGGHKVLQGDLSIGKFTTINTYFTMLIRSLSFFLGIAGSFQNIKVSLHRIQALLSAPNEEIGTKRIKKINRVKTKNLSISYHGYPVLQKCNYEFTVGKIYGIRGLNGKGKTTFLNALMGIFYGEHSGSIQYDDFDISALDMKQIRYDKISYLEQDPEFLSMDVSSFLMLGIHEKTVHNNVLSDIAKYWRIETSLNKEINDNGSNFSGGEKQKISIARIFRKSADLILLDEPTSALDKDNSKRLMDLLDTLKNDSIIVMVSHDLYALERCDTVINITDIQT